MKKTGIDDMALYLPPTSTTLEAILERRIEEEPENERRLRRAVESTGQRELRFTLPWEDSVTLAAEATRSLLRRGIDPSGLRYFATGTETSVDLSKPISAYAQGLLQRSGYAIPESLSTFQVQHACAGGTIALLSVAGLLNAAAQDGDSGLVVCSDIARYDTPSTAEITQGAGAVAMHVANDPGLLELDLRSVGFASRDEDDFFRPLGSVTARVKGRYSVDCYNRALAEAFDDHARRLDTDTKTIVNETDVFVLHVPFYNMAVRGLSKLVSSACDISSEETTRFLTERGFFDGLEPTRFTGNIYSGSLYMALMFALQERYAKMGTAMIGKTVTIASYGSGNTMTVLRARIADGAPTRISAWNLDQILDEKRTARNAEYDAFVEKRTYDLSTGPVPTNDVPTGAYYLAGIREDGYREYAIGE